MKNYLIAGIVFIILVNAVVLGGVIYNRSEPYVSTIELSGREIRLPYSFSQENSAKRVELVARVPNRFEFNGDDNQSVFFTQLSEQQLNDLGLKDLEYPNSQSQKDANEYYYKQYQVEVYLALELDGLQYERSLNVKKDQLEQLELASANSAEAVPDYELNHALIQYERERDEASRLFYIDAHKDLQTLKQKYQDQSNVLVARGTVNITYNNKDAAYSVSYAYLLVEQIMLPKDIAHNVEVDGLENANLFYTLHIGKRFEPWISQLHIK